jgi:hypothetical protein
VIAKAPVAGTITAADSDSTIIDALPRMPDLFLPAHRHPFDVRHERSRAPHGEQHRGDQELEVEVDDSGCLSAGPGIGGFLG